MKFNRSHQDYLNTIAHNVAEGDDALTSDIKRRKREASRYILCAATLIAPAIHDASSVDPIEGFNWTIEVLNQHGFQGIASELEIAKAR